MDDWYENDVTRPPFVIPAPQFVIPAEAGIQGEEWVPPVFIPLAGGNRHGRFRRIRDDLLEIDPSPHKEKRLERRTSSIAESRVKKRPCLTLGCAS